MSSASGAPSIRRASLATPAIRISDLAADRLDQGPVNTGPPISSPPRRDPAPPLSWRSSPGRREGAAAPAGRALTQAAGSRNARTTHLVV